jgi:predicted RNase H-like HicB family nuclease
MRLVRPPPLRSLEVMISSSQCKNLPGDETRFTRDPARDGLAAASMKNYLVIYERAVEGGWGAHSPDVDGVFALGTSRDEVEQRMAEALAAQLEYLRERGAPIPEPHTDAGRVAA